MAYAKTSLAVALLSFDASSGSFSVHTMIQAPTVLIVHDDLTVLARLSARLKGRAEVSTATTFGEAKAILTATPPTVLITGVRLGQYNGLHLIIRSRVDHPATVAIVIAEGVDAVLEQEARKNGAACLSYPAQDEKLLSLVAEAISRSGV